MTRDEFIRRQVAELDREMRRTIDPFVRAVARIHAMVIPTTIVIVDDRGAFTFVERRLPPELFELNAKVEEVIEHIAAPYRRKIVELYARL